MPPTYSSANMPPTVPLLMHQKSGHCLIWGSRGRQRRSAPNGAGEHAGLATSNQLGPQPGPRPFSFLCVELLVRRWQAHFRCELPSQKSDFSPSNSCKTRFLANSLFSSMRARICFALASIRSASSVRLTVRSNVA